MALTMLGRRMRSLDVAILSLTKAPNFPAPLQGKWAGDREPGSQKQNRFGEGESAMLEPKTSNTFLYHLRKQWLSFQPLPFSRSPGKNFHEPFGRGAAAHAAKSEKLLLP